MKILGVDMGGSGVKLAIADAGRVEEFRTVRVRRGAPTIETLRLVEAEARGMAGMAECVGIGVAYPGIVDTAKRRVVCINDKYTDAADVDFARWARERFSLEAILINDAAAALCGEMAYGAGRGADSAVLMMVGTGVGTAYCGGGRVTTGKHGAMGILGGHIAISFDKPRRCTCGGLGCLEAYAGTWALPGLAREHPRFEESVLKSAERIDYRALAAGCEAGDAVCADLLRNAFSALCVGAANLVRAYDPERVILSGGASRIGAMRAAIQEYLDSRCRASWGRVTVNAAENPDMSALLGLSSLFEERQNEAKEAEEGKR